MYPIDANTGILVLLLLLYCAYERQVWFIKPLYWEWVVTVEVGNIDWKKY